MESQSANRINMNYSKSLMTRITQVCMLKSFSFFLFFLA
jgi:hypothetical protein